MAQPAGLVRDRAARAVVQFHAAAGQHALVNGPRGGGLEELHLTARLIQLQGQQVGPMSLVQRGEHAGLISDAADLCDFGE